MPEQIYGFHVEATTDLLFSIALLVLVLIKLFSMTGDRHRD